MIDSENTLNHYKKIKHFNIPNHAHFLTFSCFQRQSFLTNDLWRGWLADAIRQKCDELSIALWAYVIMPEHVHVLLRPRSEQYEISAWLKSVKNSVSKRIIHHLRENDSMLLSKMKVEADAGVGYRFWQAGPGYDNNVTSIEKAVEKAAYCHKNPVTRRLVPSADRWRWSSFRWLELGNRKDEPLRVDDWVDG